MKTKKSSQIFTLKKQTVANLQANELKLVNGGTNNGRFKSRNTMCAGDWTLLNR